MVRPTARIIRQKGIRMIRWTLAIICLLMPLTSTPALAYVDRGTDPEEGVTVDIRASARKVFVTENNGRTLLISVRIYQSELGYSFLIRLDSRGDQRADFRMQILDSSAGPNPCRIFRTGRSDPVARCKVRTDVPRVEGVTLVQGRVGARRVHPSKRIRWWVEAPPPIDDSSDRAPDRGWYPD